MADAREKATKVSQDGCRRAFGRRDPLRYSRPAALRGAQRRAGVNPPLAAGQTAPPRVGQCCTGAPGPMYFSRNACIRVRKSARSASV